MEKHDKKTVIDVPFQWDSNPDIGKFRVGYVKELFELKTNNVGLAHAYQMVTGYHQVHPNLK